MGGDGLDELLERIQGLDPEGRQELEQTVQAMPGAQHIRWVPNPGPQTEAYFCEADILLYGGEAGGGKTDLLIGLAFNEHKKSLLMRREGVQLGGLTERALEINGARVGFNGSSPPKLTTADGRVIDFGSALNSGDEASWKGRPHDLLAFDEGVEFLETQVRFLQTWLRTTDADQRTRCVIATNPPTTQDGQFIVDMFAPWLDPAHPNPAKHGELRWFVTDMDGRDMDVEGPEPIDIGGGKLVQPHSRTFIPSSVRDNPFLAGRKDYLAKLDSLPEPYRSAFRDGNFLIARRDDMRQIIPSAWVRQAQQRWKPEPPVGIPMCAIGADCALGGDDDNVLAPRFDYYFAELIVTPGAETPHGKDSAAIIIKNRYDNAHVIVDIGGGFGAECYAHLRVNNIDCSSWMGLEPTNERTKDNQFGFFNKRSAAIWQFREALDPSQPGGSIIQLPPDPRMVGELTTPTYEIVMWKGQKVIKAETKDSVCSRLGRSTDRGDAVVMSWTGGAKQFMQQGGWAEHGKNRRPQVNMRRPKR